MVPPGQEFHSYWFVLHVLTRFFWSLRLTLIHFGTVCWNWCSFCSSISSSSWTEYRCYSTCVLWYQLDKSLTLIDLCYSQLRVSSGPSVLKLVLFLSFNFLIIVKSVIHVLLKCDQSILCCWSLVPSPRLDFQKDSLYYICKYIFLFLEVSACWSSLYIK